MSDAESSTRDSPDSSETHDDSSSSSTSAQSVEPQSGILERFAALKARMQQVRQSNLQASFTKTPVAGISSSRKPKKSKNPTPNPNPNPNTTSTGVLGKRRRPKWDALSVSASVSDLLSRKARKRRKVDRLNRDTRGDDFLIHAHKKRLSHIPPSLIRSYERRKHQIEEGIIDPIKDQPEDIERLVSSQLEAEQLRAQFSRRRTDFSSVGVGNVRHINERNRRYNQKIDRAFGRYTAEIKKGLEQAAKLKTTGVE